MTAASPVLAEERSVDAFLGGHVTLVQPRGGHRAGLDAALLQALVPMEATGLAIDLGAGVGTVAFCLAARAGKLAAIGIERDPELIACGNEALSMPENAAFAERVRLVEGDMTDPRAVRERAGFRAADADFVLMNPPFEPEGRISESPDERRRAAHVAPLGLIQSWSTAAAAWLKPGGTLGLIDRADALPTVFDALSRHFGGVQVMPVHPAEAATAIRILVTAKRGSRAPLAIRPGLVLHNSDGSWTQQADNILRGGAELAA